MKSTEALIEFNDLSYRYGDGVAGFAALKNISLRIHSGEFVAICGTSGSGKSTLMNLLGTLSTTEEGQFTIQGTTPAELGPEALAALRNRRIGFIFQNFQLLPRLTILDNVLLPSSYLQPRPRVEDIPGFKTRALELLEKLGIKEQANKLPAELSGGQKQRAAIARALLLDPSVILADEPTGALDSESAAEVMRILLQLNREGRTVIVVTHDPEVARLARRRIELRDGRLLADTPQPGVPFEPVLISHARDTTPKTGTRWLEQLRLSPWHQAWQSLLAAKLRSALTCLGLMIGVTAITTMLTLSSAAQDIIMKIFDRAGADRIYIGLDDQQTAGPAWNGLHVDQDLPGLQAAFADHGRIAMLWGNLVQKAMLGGQAIEATLDGLSDVQDFADQGLKIIRGRMLAPHELKRHGQVALVGSDFAESMFPPHYKGRMTNPHFPLGEVIHLRGRLTVGVTIVGVIGRRDTTFSARDINTRIVVPESLLLRYNAQKRSTWISVVPKPGVSQRWIADAVSQYLTLKTSLRYSFRAEVPEEKIQQFTRFVIIFQALTGLIGGLCILVGGIGIMNIMLVTIAERIKEIGLRKALGATQRDITFQFLSECLLLCGLSGLMGVSLGALFCNMVAWVGHHMLPDLIPAQLILQPFALLAGLATAIISGLLFGIMPALRASRLDPSTALRTE